MEEETQDDKIAQRSRIALDQEQKQESCQAVMGKGKYVTVEEGTHAGEGKGGKGEAALSPGDEEGAKWLDGKEEKDEETIPGLSELQSFTTLALYQQRDKDLTSYNNFCAINTKGKCTRVRFEGARGKEAMARVRRHGTKRGQKITPDLYKTPRRCLDSHDDDVSLGQRLHAGCHQPMTKEHSFAYVQGRMKSYTHATMLDNFLWRASKRVRSFPWLKTHYFFIRDQ